MAAPLGIDPDALHLGRVPGHHGQLGLEDDPAVNELGVRATAADQVTDPLPVAQPTPSSSGETPTSSVYIATEAGNSRSTSSGRTSRTAGSAWHRGGVSSASSGWHPRTSRTGPQYLDSRSHRPRTASDRTDERRALAGVDRGQVGERGNRGGRGTDRNDVSAEPTDRFELSARPVPENPRISAPPLQSVCTYLLNDLSSGDRRSVKDTLDRRALGITEKARI